MYILNGPRNEIIDSSFVERFCVVERNDAVLIVASYSADRKVTVSKYRDTKEARDALIDMLAAFERGDYCYEMPISSLFYGENVKRDARTQRKGGS